jgi:hypothetical protein
MRKITLLALMAGAIISAEEASAQGVYLDFGNNPGPAIATTTDLGTRIGNGTGIAVNGTGIAGTADTIGQGNFELLTGAGNLPLPLGSTGARVGTGRAVPGLLLKVASLRR